MFDSIDEASAILRGGSTGDGFFSLSVYPTSVPVSLELTRIGALTDLLAAGAGHQALLLRSLLRRRGCPCQQRTVPAAHHPQFPQP